VKILLPSSSSFRSFEILMFLRYTSDNATPRAASYFLAKLRTPNRTPHDQSNWKALPKQSLPPKPTLSLPILTSAPSPSPSASASSPGAARLPKDILLAGASLLTLLKVLALGEVDELGDIGEAGDCGAVGKGIS